MNNVVRPIFAAAIAALLAATAIPSRAAQQAAAPKGNFDGLWSVSITTLQGSCDPSYRYPARIVGTRVLQASDDNSYQLYGAVGRSGSIRVIVVRGSQWADGRGRLSGSSGQGQWRTSGGECSGSWTAVRRG